MITLKDILLFDVKSFGYETLYMHWLSFVLRVFRLLLGVCNLLCPVLKGKDDNI